MSQIALSTSQDAACAAFQKFLKSRNQTEFLLSGFAGSGKSFLVTYLIDLANDEYKLIKLIAPKAPPPNFIYTATTNKAAAVLANMVQSSAKTIHSTLGLSVFNNYRTGVVRLEQKHDCMNLNHSIVVIDEASMINHQLLHFIRKAAKKYNECKILYVGDSYQLPPINENHCPVFTAVKNIHFLTDIQRQAADSPIIEFSQQYRNILDNEVLPWPKIPVDNQTIFHYADPKSWKIAIDQEYQQQPIDQTDSCKVLAWSNDRVRGYNNWLRKQLGFTQPYEVGERLICNKALTVHNRLLAKTDSIHRVYAVRLDTQKDQQGHIITLDSSGYKFEIFQPSNWAAANRLQRAYAEQKDWNNYFKIKNEWGDFRPIHAQTVHKAQGSTYKKVFIDLTDIGKNNKWYEVARLMYVAITRASHEVHLFGELKERYIRKDPRAIMEVFENATTT